MILARVVFWTYLLFILLGLLAVFIIAAVAR